MKMYAIVTRLLVFLLTWSIFPCAEAFSEDVVGWKDVSWGMTVEEIKKLYPNITCLGNGNCSQKNPVVISQVEYALSFAFDGVEPSSKLTGVDLWSDYSCKYKDIYGVIQGKYGEHSVANKTRNAHEYFWHKKSGVIKLNVYTDFYGTPSGMCRIEYKKSSDSDNI